MKHRNPHRSQHRSHPFGARALRAGGILLGIALLAACGGSDDAAPSNGQEDAPSIATSDNSADDGSAADDGAADDGAADDQQSSEPADVTEPDEPAAAPSGGSGTATLTLDNGDTMDFDVRCSLEPQIAAGSEILFTATSARTPGIDITQFGDEGTVTGIASVTVFDESYESLWDAGSLFEAFGGELELALDGSTITAVGSFYPGGDIQADPVNGSVVANC